MTSRNECRLASWHRWSGARRCPVGRGKIRASLGRRSRGPFCGNVCPDQRCGPARCHHRHAGSRHGHQHTRWPCVFLGGRAADRGHRKPGTLDHIGLGVSLGSRVLHFVFGRYCNFRASQAAGVNLTAPVMQLNSVVTLVLAVVVLREPCTMLQVAGAVLMVAGSLVTQRGSRKPSSRPLDPTMFAPRIAVGFFFASMAALAYGTSPIVIRQALLDGGPLAVWPAAWLPTQPQLPPLSLGCSFVHYAAM